jgi:hypothetical protein
MPALERPEWSRLANLAGWLGPDLRNHGDAPVSAPAGAGGGAGWAI